MKTSVQLIVSALFLTSTPFLHAEPPTIPNTNIQVGTQSEVTGKFRLLSGNWDAFNKSKLDKMISEYGKDNANYNSAKPPYVVFDWDNTSIFLDIAEAVLVYQLEHLRFKMTPSELNIAIRKNLPSDNFSTANNNAAGQPVSINTLAPDIIESYTWLYKNYDGLKGNKSLDEIKQSPHYQNFIVKMRYLYDAVGDTFDHSVSYPWVTYLFTGMTEREVRNLTAETIRWQKTQPVESVTWTSPNTLPGKAGVVSVTWKNGVRTVAEMQNLYNTLRNAGFDVWVCSASFVDIIKEFSSNPAYGYNNPANRVLAMELERDKTGRIKTQFRKGYDQTQGEGKTKTIKRFLVSKYGYGPIFIAGDSEGDQNMMQDFADTKLVLIINRLRSNDIGKLSKIAAETYKQPSAKYLLQGRDDNNGVFVKSQLHYKLGHSNGKLLK